jgi:hypothetical protein
MFEADVSEPDSVETNILNSFLEAINEGDGQAAARALRSGANLADFAIAPVLLAAFFENTLKKSKIYPRRLTLEKRGKGRPKKIVNLTKLDFLGLGDATAFFKWIANGKATEAVGALCVLQKLEGFQLALLADLFDDSPSLSHLAVHLLRPCL